MRTDCDSRVSCCSTVVAWARRARWYLPAILVFVDCMKELPATLILRPFDFETLATTVFMLASLDQLEESALPALTIVLVGLVPVILLSRTLHEPHITS